MDAKITQPESQLPKQWYNIILDMPGPLAPVLKAQPLKPATPGDLLAIFPLALIEQEVSTQCWFDLPEKVREI